MKVVPGKLIQPELSMTGMEDRCDLCCTKITYQMTWRAERSFAKFLFGYIVCHFIK